MMKTYARMQRNTALALLGLLCALVARADDDEGGRAVRTPPLPTYAQECAACHIAYPPELLGPASWRRIMGSLDRHFGTDASLDGPTARQIATWLAANGARRTEDPVPEDRITRSAWFVREHREAASGTTGKRRRLSDCAACHAGAAQGLFGDDSGSIR